MHTSWFSRIRNGFLLAVIMLFSFSFQVESAPDAPSLVEHQEPGRSLSSFRALKHVPRAKMLGARIEAIQEKVAQLSSERHSALSDRVEEEFAAAQNKFGLGFYEPNYILPFYNTFSVSPFYQNNPGNTPNNIPIKHEEFKAQLSFLVPVWMRVFKSNWSLNLAYTQLMYWQLYAKTPFFRETNYEPRLFLSYYRGHNWFFSVGIDHQSNGRGGINATGMERSWNRAFMDLMFSGRNWLLIVEPWVPILRADSADWHNPDIARYLGYGRIVFSYRFWRQSVSLIIRNELESGFKRGAVEIDYSFPLSHRFKGFVQIFSGYGQSLIEYNHATTGVGVGVALNNWI